ncbi:DNA polymerase III subunit delta [Salegentibacter sp. HM20]
MDEARQIVNDIQRGDIKPLYFLMGEEPYYIDKISGFIAENLLPEEEKGFNQVSLYGRDTSIEDIISNARRYPMMAERQVVIVKEAQELSRTIEKLESYAENPQPTTVLVICYKLKKLDKRKKIYKNIAKTGVIFESKKLYENQVGDWIVSTMKTRGYSISMKAAQMLVEFLGNDLGKIDNELGKLQLITPKDQLITPELIEENIGISKDFNNFELRKAIGNREVQKAHRIINYFAQNPKDNPLVVTVSLLFAYFSQIMQYHGLADKSKASVAKQLKINPYFVQDYVIAARNYKMKEVSQIISELKAIDIKSKGVGAVNVSQGDLLKELLVKIMQ